MLSDNKGLVTMHCDNQAIFAYTKDPKYHYRTKHIDTKYNFVRDIIEQKEVAIQYISTHQMVADPFTKKIAKDVYMKHEILLGLCRL